MKNISLNIEKTFDFVSQSSIFSYENDAFRANEALHTLTRAGNDFLGWVTLPQTFSESEIKDIEETAANLREKSEIVVVIGIGGSYLGAKAVISALENNFSHLQKNRKNPLILFAGQNICEDYLFELRETLKNVSYSLIVISKSGTTTEPAIAFRILKSDLEAKYGKEEAKNRIVAITDKAKGALRKLSDQEGYKSFIITDDIGGRYSVLTPVGLLPIAAAGFNIRELLNGAKTMFELTNPSQKFENNIAAIYAVTRYLLYKNCDKKVEILVNYYSKLHYVSEWWKQLYGESEGKNGKGLFTASVNFTTDLHSLGQYIQDGERHLFETVLSVQKPQFETIIPPDEQNLDQLNYLAGKRMSEVNKMAEIGTMLAHTDGRVPCISIEIPEMNEFYLGEMLYFFEKACGISGYLLEVNPFDQPGVEAYKNNMFALLGKAGYETLTQEIKNRLK